MHSLPPNGPARYQSLDAWRGFACLCLVAFHCTFYYKGASLAEAFTIGSWAERLMWILKKTWFGVPMFFVISGYGIMKSLQRLRSAPKPARTFFLRRFFRIYPPLWLALCLALILWTLPRGIEGLAGCDQTPRPPDMAHLLGNISLTETWLPWHWLGQKENLQMLHLWTLCLEEQFYLICTVLLALWPKKIEQALYWVSLLVVLSMIYSISVGEQWKGSVFQGYWLQFAAGAAAYFAILNQQRKTLQTVLIFAGLLGANLLLSCQRDTESLFRIGDRGIFSVLFAVLLTAVYRWDAQIALNPVGRALAKVGQFSYSIFLVHYPVVTLLSSWLVLTKGYTSALEQVCVVIPTCFAASLPLAWLFYHGVEKHFNPHLTVKGQLPQLSSTKTDGFVINSFKGSDRP
jgi:peptidoglycan/LPS O-acetylase OafA/YrhL